jgi:hypothetical protein
VSKKCFCTLWKCCWSFDMIEEQVRNVRYTWYCMGRISDATWFHVCWKL